MRPIASGPLAVLISDSRRARDGTKPVSVADERRRQAVGAVDIVPGELALHAGGDPVRRTVRGLDLQNVAVLGPDVEAAADAAVRTDRLGTPDAGLPHCGFGFRDAQDRPVADLRLDALDHVDHTLERGLRERRQEARMSQHRRFHQRIARADGHAVATRDAARFADLRAAVPEHARVRVLPANRQGLVHLHVLAGLDAAAAENALTRVVTIEGIGVVDRVRLRLEGNPLVLDGEQLGRVVDGAVPVVVVADRAVEEMVAEDTVERRALRALRGRRPRRHHHPVAGLCSARPHQLAPDLHQAGVTGLDGPEARVVAHVRNADAAPVEEVDEALMRRCFVDVFVDGHTDHRRSGPLVSLMAVPQPAPSLERARGRRWAPTGPRAAAPSAICRNRPATAIRQRWRAVPC